MPYLYMILIDRLTFAGNQCHMEKNVRKVHLWYCILNGSCIIIAFMLVCIHNISRPLLSSPWALFIMTPTQYQDLCLSSHTHNIWTLFIITQHTIYTLYIITLTHCLDLVYHQTHTMSGPYLSSLTHYLDIVYHHTHTISGPHLSSLTHYLDIVYHHTCTRSRHCLSSHVHTISISRLSSLSYNI